MYSQRIRSVLEAKKLLTAPPDATVEDAAKSMAKKKAGAVLVVEGTRLVGIFTERDAVFRVMAAGKDPKATRLADVMTRELLVCSPETDIVEARRIMVFRRIRNLPVIDKNGGLVGLVSLVDLNAHDFKDQEMENSHLKNYIYGRN